MTDREIEVRFLEIDKADLITKLRALNAEDLGEELLDEIIFYDTDNTWQAQQKMVRIRKTSRGTFLAYKQNQKETVDGTHEVELQVSDFITAKKFLEALGFLYPKRQQQKKRHTFKIDDVTVDIDTWPKIPSYVELEGPSEDHLRQLATKLDLDWKKAEFSSAKAVIERHYGIPVTSLEYYTFDKIQ